MKKLSLALVLVMLCSIFTPALAATYDMSYVRSNPDVYTIDVETDGGDSYAFIETQLTTADLSYSHKYDSTVKYSSTRFDILVLDYMSSSAYPVHRLWIRYNTETKHQYFNAVTFTINGVDYTFTDVGDTDRCTFDGTTYRESLLIKFGWDNLSFLVALEKIMPDTVEELDLVQIPMTLHGTEDIHVMLGGEFLMDFVFFRRAFLESNGSDFLDKADTTPMTVNDPNAQ